MKSDECDFAMIWSFDHKDSCIYVSLRGERNDVDLSVIAKKFKGGGHPKASAFKWNNTIDALFDKDKKK